MSMMKVTMINTPAKALKCGMVMLTVITVDSIMRPVYTWIDGQCQQDKHDMNPLGQKLSVKKYRYIISSGKLIAQVRLHSWAGWGKASHDYYQQHQAVRDQDWDQQVSIQTANPSACPCHVGHACTGVTAVTAVTCDSNWKSCLHQATKLLTVLHTAVHMIQASSRPQGMMWRLPACLPALLADATYLRVSCLLLQPVSQS